MSGIWIANTVALLFYCLVKRNQPEIYPNMILPSIISGIMWALACSGWMVATAYLGFTVGYVLVAIGPMIVNSFWTTVVYREISGKKNIIILLASLSVAVGGVVLLALSH
jgi:glucose uptake protein GlcU